MIARSLELGATEDGVEIEVRTVPTIKMNNFFDGRGGAAGGGGPIQWFHSLPPVTRLWLGSTLTVSALANFEILQWTDLDLTHLTDVFGKVGGGNSNISSSSLFGRLEVWRLLTCFLYIGKFGWNSIINLHLMTQISARYETMGPICTRRILVPQNPQLQRNNQNNSPYYLKGETSDYVFALLFGMTGILLSQFYLLPYILSPSSHTFRHHYRFFHRHLTFYTLYIWSKRYPQHNVNLFGVIMKAAYLPYAYLVMGYALSNGEVIPIDMVHGMFVGHLYYYLACVVPTVLGRRKVVIWTPGILIEVCRWLEGRRPYNALGGGEPIVVDTDGVIGG